MERVREVPGAIPDLLDCWGWGRKPRAPGPFIDWLTPAAWLGGQSVVSAGTFFSVLGAELL